MIRSRLRFSTLILFLTVLWPLQVSHAEIRSHIQVNTRSSQVSLINQRSFFVHGYRDGIGRISGNFKVQKSYDAPIITHTSRGSTQVTRKVFFGTAHFKIPRYSGKKAIRLEGALLFEGNSPNLFLPIKLHKEGRSPRSITIASNRSKDHNHRLIRFAHERSLLCKAIHPHVVQSGITRRTFSLRSTGQSLVLGVDLDSRFLALHKQNTELAALLALNKAATVYQNTFGITIKIGAINIFTSSNDPVKTKYPSSIELLEAYRVYRIQNPISGSNLYHLMTAQRGFIDAIGLAYMGVTCAIPSYSSSWSDYGSGFFTFAQTVIHEIGHTFNASHDVTDERSVMSIASTVNTVNPYFSQFSIQEMTSHISANGTCLMTDFGTALPTPSATTYRTPNEKSGSIIISARVVGCRSKKCLQGKILTKTNKPLSKRVVNLLTYPPPQIIKTTFTNSLGEFRFTLPRKGSYYIADRMTGKTTSLFKVR